MGHAQEDTLSVPKGDVGNPKLLCLMLVGGVTISILAHMEKIIKCNSNQVGSGSHVSTRQGLEAHLYTPFWYSNRDGKARNGRRVSSMVSFYLLFERTPVLPNGIWTITWVWSSSQFKFCSNRMQHDLNCLVSGLVTMSSPAMSYERCKGLQGLDGGGCRQYLQFGVHINGEAELCPSSPIL